MATPTIEAISTQDITIDTDYALEIGITNDPEEVTVGGLLEGFYYSWDAANDTLTIIGEATRLLGDAMWVVSAKETPTSAAVTSEITYNVVLAAPIIEEVGEKIIFQGGLTNIFVGIQNKPTKILIDGLLTSLKSEAGADGEGDDEMDGVRMSGLLPTPANLTVDSGDLSIIAINDGGEDAYDMPFVIVPGSTVYLFDQTNNNLLKVSPDGSLLWTYDAPSGTYDPVSVISDGSVYLFNELDNDLLKVSPEGELLWTYEAPIGAYYPMSVASDGSVYLFRDFNNEDDLRKVSPEGSLLWALSARTTEFVVAPDDSVYLISSNNDDLRKVSPEGSLLWTLNVPISGYQPMVVISDGSVYLFDESDDDLLKVSPEGELLWTYNAPVAAYNNMVLASDDSVYLFDDSNLDDNLRKVSSEGVLLWTWTNSALSFELFDNISVALDDSVYLFNEVNDDLLKVSSSGSLLWTHEAPSRTYDPIAVASDGSVYLFRDTNNALLNDILLKVSSGGELLWEYNAPQGTYFSMMSIAADNSVHLFSQGSNFLLKVSPEGELLWEYDAPSGTYEQLVLA